MPGTKLGPSELIVLWITQKMTWVPPLIATLQKRVCDWTILIALFPSTGFYYECELLDHWLDGWDLLNFMS